MHNKWLAIGLMVDIRCVELFIVQQIKDINTDDDDIDR
jgi:hypothetical protein